MISGNQNWTGALGQSQKQPLYIFQILQFGIIISSFDPSLIQPQAGLGVTLYGIGGYGT
jgi:hypothetical protein